MENNLINMYRKMHPERLQAEIDSMFEHIHAMLEACDCYSMESYPDPSTRIKMSYEVLEGQNQSFLC